MKELLQRIAVIMLMAVMTLSFSSFAFADVFAEDNDTDRDKEKAAATVISEEDTDNASGSDPVETETDNATDTVAENKDDETDAESGAEDNGADKANSANKKKNIGSGPENDQQKEDAVKALSAKIEDAEALLENADVYTDSSVKALEDEITTAKELLNNQDASADAINDEVEALDAAIKGLTTKTKEAAVTALNDKIAEAEALLENAADYTTGSVKALKNEIKTAKELLDNKDATTAALNSEVKALDTKIKGLKPKYDAPVKRSLSSFTAYPKRCVMASGASYNLRNYIGASVNSYATVQGSCIDDKGEYAYYLMNNNDTDYGRLIKIRMSDGYFMGASSPYYFHHGNGMCFDSKRNRVVVSSYSNTRMTITYVNPNNLNDITQKRMNMWAVAQKLGSMGIPNSTGSTAMSYIKKYDCYVSMQRSDHNIIIYDAESLVAMAASVTNFQGLGGTFQSIDADETYVYFLISDVGGSSGINNIVCFDWHAEKYAELLDSGQTATDEPAIWYSGSNGTASAVINVSGAHEIESMFHVDQGGGKARFFLVDYNYHAKYKTVTEKVKWKKVKKTVKVKKKVKKIKKWWHTKKQKWVKKKPPKKYRGQKKTTYKYKTVKKKKKVWVYKYEEKKVLDYYERDSFPTWIGDF